MAEERLGGAHPLAKLSDLAGLCRKSSNPQQAAVAYALQTFFHTISDHLSDRAVESSEADAIASSIKGLIPEVIDYLTIQDDDPARAIELIARVADLEDGILTSSNF